MVECEFSKELGSIGRLHGFNRYMVECESLSDLLKVYIANRFNRYMVECEFYQILLYQGHIFVLIDTWWNVNNLISKY